MPASLVKCGVVSPWHDICSSYRSRPTMYCLTLSSLHLLQGEWKGTTPVAIKTLKEGTMTKEDFLKEARIMKTFNHPHIVRLFAVVTTEPIYIVTELMPNGSLLAFLRSDVDKTLGLKDLVDFMSQVGLYQVPTDSHSQHSPS